MEINETQHVMLLKDSISGLKKIALLLVLTTLGITANSQTQELNIGAATADITPTVPVALMGQFELCIAHNIEFLLTANVYAQSADFKEITQKH